MQPERRAVVDGRERVLHLVAVAELRRRGDDRLERRIGETREPLERVRDPALLRGELRVVGEILEPAAAAGRVVRTRRRDTLRPGNEHLGRDRLGVTPLHLRHARAHGVAGKPAAHEDDEAVEPRDAVAAEGERIDRELELLVSLHGAATQGR